MTLGELSLNARIAYTKSLAVLLRSGIIDSENRILAIKLANALASSSALQVRIKATAVNATIAHTAILKEVDGSSDKRLTCKHTAFKIAEIIPDAA